MRCHYDSRLRSCRRFTYGGCAGNANNFKTEKACLQRCSARSKQFITKEVMNDVYSLKLKLVDTMASMMWGTLFHRLMAAINDKRIDNGGAP